MPDSSCKKIGINQIYDVVTKSFSCVENYYEVDGYCRPLPSNAIYDTANKQFKCLGGYYLLNYDCLACHSTCLECSSATNCLKCPRGYAVNGGACE